MDGLGRSIGDGISGMVGGAINAIGGALAGMLHAVTAALPAGAVPVIGIALVLFLAVLLKR
jgi:hypothetical protein